LLCFQYVCRNQADAEQGAEKHKQHADTFLFFHIILVLLKGVRLRIAFSSTPISKSGCKITKKNWNHDSGSKFFSIHYSLFTNF
jgi:hypothetical protein